MASSKVYFNYKSADSRILSVQRYELMRERRIQNAVDDEEAFNSWLMFRGFTPVQLFFIDNETHTAIWETWIKSREQKVDQALEAEWMLREIEV